MDEEPLTRVGDYEVLGVLGAGGMGKVYKVRNVITDRVEAMKILLPDLAHRRALAERFLREIKLLAGLSHPNIASLHTALTWNNQLVMVMEYVEGVTLAVRIKDGPMSVEEAVDYISQVLSALSYAHERHIVHRDIKPANMMLTAQGVVKLMDFGIARAQGDPALTAQGSTLGSLSYMSPEQVKGEAADERSDIYSTGVSLYEMVTGQRPFRADNEYAVMAAHLQKQPEPPINLRPDLPTEINEIILKAMAKDPGQRFQKASAFLAALRPTADENGEARTAVPLPTAPGLDVTGAAATPPIAAVRAAIRGSRVERTPVLPEAEVASVPPAATGAGIAPAAGSGGNVEPPSEVHQETGNVQPPPAVAQSSVAAGIPSQPPPSVNTHRGLYVALGSVIVLIVLIIAGISIPRLSKTHAGDEVNFPQSSGRQAAPTISPHSEPNSDVKSGADESRSMSVPEPPSTPPKPDSANDSGAKKSLSANSARRESGVAGTTVHRSNEMVSSPVRQNERAAAAPTPVPNVSNVPAPPVNAAKLQELEHDMDLLSSRAEAVDSSLEGLRQNQAAQGLGLRGDIAGSQQRMRTYITKAQSALRDQDPDQAKKYLDLAETEVAKLEKFLGR